MTQHQGGIKQGDKHSFSSSEEKNVPITDATDHHEIDSFKIQEDPLAHKASTMLDKADTYIYAIVGGCFLLGAILALIYTFWAFGVAVIIELPSQPASSQPGIGAQAIINFISGLLLVLIIMEVLGTVLHYLKSHETSLRPFLFIGIVSATRSILSIGARLSVGGVTEDFNHAMIELGVSAAVILALGVTLKLLGKLVEGDSSGI